MTLSVFKRAALFLLLVAALLPHAAAAQTPQPPRQPCKARPEHRQFDFWVGE